MSFWQDARPATPWFRRPRRRRGRWPGPRVVGAALLVVAIIVAVGVVVTRADRRGPREPAAAAMSRKDDAQGRVTPARWSRTLPDEPTLMLADHSKAVVIGSSWVSTIRAGDGTVQWKTRVEQVNPHGALRGDTVLLSNRAGFVALDRRTGEYRWRVETPETPGVVALAGPAGKPAVAVVSTEEGALAGLDSRTGDVRWKARFPGLIVGVPAVDRASGALVALWRDAARAKLRVVDAGTGALRWERELPLLAGSPIVTHAPAGHRMIVVGAGTGHFDAQVRAFDLADGSVRWHAPVPASFQSGLELLADGDALYVVDQHANVTRLELATGARRWSTDTPGATIRARPVRAGSAILVSNLSGEILAVDRVSGALRARRPTTGHPIGVAVAHDLVLIAERLVDERQLEAFRGEILAGSARNPG